MKGGVSTFPFSRANVDHFLPERGNFNTNYRFLVGSEPFFSLLPEENVNSKVYTHKYLEGKYVSSRILNF
jgi:hypothetical protein